MNSKPHLLIYSDSHILGGADRYLLSIVPVLIDYWQITFVYRKDVDFKSLITQLEKYKVRCLPVALDGFSIDKIVKLKKFFLEEKPDLIVFNQGHFYNTKNARVAAILTKIPHLIIQHGSPLEGRKNFNLQNMIFARLTFVKALTMIVPSKASSAFLTKYHPYIKAPLVINHGIDLTIFDPKKYNQKLIIKNLGLPEDCFVVTFMGRLLPDKNPEWVLSVFEKIAEKNPKVQLLMVGEGELKSQLKKNITKIISDRVHFLGFSQNPAEILAISDLMMLTSRSEAFGLVVIESMAMGATPVAFDVDSLSAIIKDSGKTVPYGDLEGLQKVIQGIIDNPGQKKNMVLAGQERVKKLFDLKRMQKVTLEVFNKYLPPIN